MNLVVGTSQSCGAHAWVVRRGRRLGSARTHESTRYMSTAIAANLQQAKGHRPELVHTRGKAMLSGHARKCAHVVQLAASAQPRMCACEAQISGLEPLAVGARREDTSAENSSHHAGYFTAHLVSMCGPIRTRALPCARSTVGPSDTTHQKL